MESPWNGEAAGTINQQSHVCRSLNELQHTQIGLISSIQPSLYKYIRTLSMGYPRILSHVIHYGFSASKMRKIGE